MFRSVRLCQQLFRCTINGGLRNFSKLRKPRKIFFESTRTMCIFSGAEFEEGDFVYDAKVKTFIESKLCSVDVTIDWDKFFRHPEFKATEEFVNLPALVLITCRMKNLPRQATSFFLYLVKNKKLSAGLLKLFCDFMYERPDSFRKCEEIIFKLFSKLQNTEKTLAEICARVLFKSPKYSDQALALYKRKFSSYIHSYQLIISLIEGNKVEEALEVLECGAAICSEVESMFLKHFQKEVEQGRIPSEIIKKYLSAAVKFPPKAMNVGNIEIVKDLFTKIDRSDKHYRWILDTNHKASSICPYCKGVISTTEVSEKEIEILHGDFTKNIVFGSSIYEKSDYNEWNTFNKFLRNTEYNIVMDGLNVKYFFCNEFAKFKYLMEDLKKHKLKPLLLARTHFRTFPEYKAWKSKYPIFLTEDLTHDDSFVIYAALIRGKGCLIASNDKMRFCKPSLSQDILPLFHRWQATHHCSISSSGHVLFPRKILFGLQGSECNSNGEFKFHYIIDQNKLQPSSVCISRVKR